MCLHIIAIITIFILPKFIRGEKRPKATSSNASFVVDCNTTQHNQLTKNDLTQELTAGSQVTTSDLVSATGDDQSLNTHKRLIVDPGMAQRQPVSVPTALAAISVAHDQCEMDNLSSKLKEKIDMETKNIEEFIDKTVTETVSGIVGFKNDLMRDSDKIFISQDGIRKRIIGADKGSERVDVFLKKEIDAINAVVQQANVLPVVLSNGHAK